MRVLFLFLLLITVSTNAQTMKIEQEKWTKEQLFCNIAIFSIRTKIMGGFGFSPKLTLKHAFNPLNYKALTFDYFLLDFYHFRLNFSAEYDYANHGIPWTGNSWSNTAVLYDAEVRKLSSGIGLYYDFNFKIKTTKRLKPSKSYRFRFQPGFSILPYLFYTTTYFYKDDMKLQIKQGPYFNVPKFIIRDEIRLIITHNKKVSFGISAAYLMHKYARAIGPVDYPLPIKTIGISILYNSK